MVIVVDCAVRNEDSFDVETMSKQYRNREIDINSTSFRYNVSHWVISLHPIVRNVRRNDTNQMLKRYRKRAYGVASTRSRDSPRAKEDGSVWELCGPSSGLRAPQGCSGPGPAAAAAAALHPQAGRGSSGQGLKASMPGNTQTPATHCL